MEKYFCNCLNVIINVSQKDTRESVGQDLIHVDLLQNQNPGNVDSFFAGKLLDVRLSISGIEVSQSALQLQRSYADWLVYSCINCGVDTYAMHVTKGADRVLLSCDIPHGDETFEKMKQCTLFSKPLKIIAIPYADRAQNNAISSRSVNIHDASENLNNSCKKLLQAEEDAKNERIRIFTQKEDQQFREFKMKAGQDKEKLLQNLRQLSSSKSPLDVDDNIFNASMMEERDSFSELRESKKNPRPLFSLFPSKEEGLVDSPEFEPDFPISQSVPATFGMRNMSGLSQRINNSNKGKVKKSSEKRHSSHNDDILFDMEGYNNERNCEPFYESDEESSGDATSLESSGGFSGSRGIAMSSSSKRDGSKSSNHQNYACSMPVAVPLFHNTRTSYDPESEDEEEKVSSPSLSKLAISFKQVAKSMQDSTGMFGDLPRRRTESSFRPPENPFVSDNPFVSMK